MRVRAPRELALVRGLKIASVWSATRHLISNGQHSNGFVGDPEVIRPKLS
jgi:hypothetical protein